MTLRVAMYGSCVTRDVAELPGRRFELTGYWARSSWISQAGAPVAVDPSALTGVSGFAQRVVLNDIKSDVVDALVATSPDLVLVDLIDERFGLWQVGDGWLTRSTYFVQAGGDTLVRPRRRLSLIDEERLSLFTEAVEKLSAQLSERLPCAQVLVHRAMYATRTSAAPFTDEQLQRADLANGALTAMYDVLAAVPGWATWQAPEDVVVADPEHKWGLDHFHYVPEYYARLLEAVEGFQAAAVAG